VCMCTCVYVCVSEREWEREEENGKVHTLRYTHTLTQIPSHMQAHAQCTHLGHGSRRFKCRSLSSPLVLEIEDAGVHEADLIPVCVGTCKNLCVYVCWCIYISQAAYRVVHTHINTHTHTHTLICAYFVTTLLKRCFKSLAEVLAGCVCV
jgi:hypothetical protein